jgi:nicotinate-nucleotide adenylyltransferase
MKPQRSVKHVPTRIGLFGGTFNPIHIGHLRAASEVAEGFNLKGVLFIPSSLPPHKEFRDIAPSEKRLEMTRLAVKGTPLFTVSNVEIARCGVSYTIDTVKYFKKSFSGREELFLIMGMDAFLEVDTWKSYGEIFKLVPVIVMERPGIDHQPDQRKKHLIEFMRKKISDTYQFDESQQMYYHQALQPIYHFPVSLLDISGTKIRACLHQGKSIRFLVPERVENYIYEQGLYV